MVNDIVNRLARCERETFIVDEFRGRPDAPPFTIVTGSMPVMVSAPHAVTQMREGKPKPSEDYTGSIALEIARKLDCHAIVATRTSDGDPNWDDFATCAYKQALVAHVSRHEIALVLDLHGMIAASPALAAIGTNDGMTTRFRPELDEAALAILNNALAAQTERHGKPIELNGRYAARSGRTIASAVAGKAGICALQVELATQVRVPNRIKAHIPRDAPAHFPGTGLLAEFEARRNPDPEGVVATIDALAQILLLATE